MAAAPHTPLIEADIDDNDSAIDVRSLASSTASVTSSIFRSREENGRTYHAYKDGKYVFPDDDNEKERLNLQHYVFLITFDGKLSLVPESKTIQRVLDVGTGTGLWALEYGDEHSEAQVLGVDLSPMQPNFAAPNVVFEIDDLEEPWLYHEKFDLIHMRAMTGAFQDFPKFFRQAFEFTNPGGYLEASEVVLDIKCDDDSLTKDSALYKMAGLVQEAMVKSGRPGDSAYSYKKWMEEAGWTDIVERWDVWPGSRWPKDAKLKELGLWTQENMRTGLEALVLALYTRVLGWSLEEVQVFLIDVRKELKDYKIHWYYPVYSIYGKKPE